MNRAIIWIVIVLGIAYVTQEEQTVHSEQLFGENTTTIVPVENTAPTTNAPPTNHSVRRVTVIGDSLTLGARDFLQSPNNPTLRIVVDAKKGRSLSQSSEIVQKIANQTDLLVIALGTNDCASDLGSNQINQLVWSSLGATQEKPVILLTLGENGPIKNCAIRFNQVAKSQAATTPHLRIVDWQAVVQGHPEWYGSNGDGIHLTPAGYKGRAEWLLSQIAS